MDVIQTNIAYYDSLETKEPKVFSPVEAEAVRRNAIARTAGKKQRAARMLEAGCGTGWLASCLTLSGFAAAAVRMDISSGMLKACRESARLNGLEADVVRGDCQRLPFRDGTFDFICGGGFLHHLEEEGKFFSEARRVLQPGGVLLLYREPQKVGSAVVVAIVKVLTAAPAALLRLFKARLPESAEHELGKTYSAGMLRRFGEDAGLELIACRGHSFLHSIHWYLEAKASRFRRLAGVMKFFGAVANFLDEKALRYFFPRFLYYELSAGFRKPDAR